MRDGRPSTAPRMIDCTSLLDWRALFSGLIVSAVQGVKLENGAYGKSIIQWMRKPCLDSRKDQETLQLM